MKNGKLTKLLENHKIMPTCKHFDISTVLQSNMNSELDKVHTWLSKKLSLTIIPSKENCLGLGGGWGGMGGVVVAVVIQFLSNQFLIQYYPCYRGRANCPTFPKLLSEPFT